MTIYRVRPGDTIPSVACQNGILPTILAAENGLTPDAPLTEGQALLISPAARTCHVKEGDTLLSVSRRYGVRPTRLRQLNPALGGGDAVFPGMTLTLDKAAPPRATISVTGIVAAGTPTAALIPTLPYLTFLAIADGRISPDGHIALPDDAETVALARSMGVVPLLMLRANGNGRDGEETTTHALFDSDAGGERLLDTLPPLLRERGYGGVMLDLPFLTGNTADAFRLLVMRLRRRLGHSSLVMVNHTPGLSPSDPFPTVDLAPLGRAAGALSLATYDFASRYGAPAPHAPFDKVKAVAEEAALCVRPQKLFLGISTRSHDHPVGGGDGCVHPAADVPELVRSNGGTICYDPVARLPYASLETNGERRILFFEDAWSLWEKLLLVDDLGIGGITLSPAASVATSLLMTLASAFRIVRLHGD